MSSSFISPNSLKLGPFSKFSSTVAPKVSRALPFLKTFARGVGVLPGIRIGTGLWSGTSRLLSGEPMHKVGLGYAQAIPGPIGWSAVAADTADRLGAFSNTSGGNPASNFTGGLPNTAPSTGMANIPATVPSTGQSHKDFEIQQRQEQGAYIPPGMTTSAGVPVEAQPGGQQSLYDSDRAAWLHKTRNSPAARSGAFTDEERWQTQLGHQQWKKDNNRSFNYGEFLN
jgi:hypothetical protein